MIFKDADCLWSYFWSGSEWDYYLPDGEGRVDLTGAWHSVIQTWDGSVYRCFIDGVEATYAVHEWRSDARTKAWGGNLGKVIFNRGQCLFRDHAVRGTVSRRAFSNDVPVSVTF